MRSRAHVSPSRQSKDRRKVARIIIGSAASLVIVFVVLPGELGTGRHPTQNHNTTTTTLSLSDIRSTYEAVLSEYNVGLASSNAVLATAATDITVLEERIQNDAKTYTYNKSGNGCSGNVSNFDSCLTNEQLTAQFALGDESLATRRVMADVSKQVKSVRQIETAITAFVQQLDGITWPSSVSLLTSNLTQALIDERSTYVQVGADLANGKSLSAESQAIATATSTVATPLAALASALGIPPPSPVTTS